VIIGERLRTKRDRAAKEYTVQLESFTLFTAEQGERVAGWRRMVEEYEADGTKKNPYRMTTRGKFFLVKQAEGKEILIKSLISRAYRG
jgi:hypothetical protein